MTGVLYALARFCVRRRFVVLAVWLVVAIALVVVSAPTGRQHQRQPLAAGDRQPARDRHAGQSFPDQANGSSPIVLHVPSGKLTDSKYSSAVNEAAADVAKAKYVASVVNPLTPQGASALSKDQATGYLSVTLRQPGIAVGGDAQTIIDAAAKPAERAGLEVETGGQLGQKVSKPSTESSELIGILAAMVILTLTFGTVVSMLLPILNAIVALLSTLAIIRMLGHVITVPTRRADARDDDRARRRHRLCAVHRHAAFPRARDGLDLRRVDRTRGRDLRRRGGVRRRDRDDRARLARGGEYPAGHDDGPDGGDRGRRRGARGAHAAAGDARDHRAAHQLAARARRAVPRRRPPSRGCGRSGRTDIAKHPLIAGLAALAILIPLTIPLLSLNLGQQDIAALSTSTTARQAYDLISENFGPGVNGPLLVAVSLGSPAQNGAERLRG